MTDLRALLSSKYETMAAAESAAIDALNHARLRGLGWDEMASEAAVAAFAAVLPVLLAEAWEAGWFTGAADIQLRRMPRTPNPYRQEQ